MPSAKDDKEKKVNIGSRKKAVSKRASTTKQTASQSEASTQEITKRVQEAPITVKYLTRGQGLVGYFLTIIISVLTAVLITVLAIPLILGVNPISFYKGDFLDKSATSKTVIKTDGEESAVTAVAKKVAPSIVTISVAKQQDNSFLFPLEPTSPDEAAVTGSGVIYRSDGYIITNNHVVEDAGKVVVTIGESTDIPAKVISGDSEVDLAVIKVGRTDLQAAQFGSTKNLKVGDLAVAIGTPFKFQHTVTSGIISAKNRVLEVDDSESRGHLSASKTLTGLIQTDAAINPGNSGGALADIQGQIIGINTVIASDTQTSAGIGFAIPIERVKDAIKQLMKNGKVRHPYIGVKIIDSSKVVDKSLPKGVFVVSVMVGSPAYKSGLKAQDVITKLSNKQVKNTDKFISMIREHKIGDKITVTFFRNNKTHTISVAIANKPANLQP